MHCIVCQQAFDFAAGETAIVLRHIAYGFDFAHAGACLATAREWIFAEPGYDRPAFSLDGSRILATEVADGWTAVMPQPAERVLAGDVVRFEPLRWWALIEYRDGSSRVEGIVREADWDEPGGAELPAACIDYAARTDERSPARRAQWAALIAARYRGETVRASAPSGRLGLRRAA